VKKQIVKIVLGAVVMLGTATASFADPKTGYPMGSAVGNHGCDVFHVDCSASPTSR